MVMVSIHTIMFTTSSYQPQLMYLRAWVLIQKSGRGGLGGGRNASPQSRMQAPLLTCNADSFQQKISNVILRDVNTVQNASYMRSHVFTDAEA